MEPTEQDMLREHRRAEEERERERAMEAKRDDFHAQVRASQQQIANLLLRLRQRHEDDKHAACWWQHSVNDPAWRLIDKELVAYGELEQHEPNVG